ncbi:hypothetical protein LRP31_14470 [Mesorhizobium mediterraneum]|uniref:hypothetical protein n=1 Tax=Mesorhizobium mediterraneum TaxID=43617 RepID=UPI00197F4E9E|nr:hypothetical protein [Mesorhizobium mediterraneum]WIW56276.1 hypothetical protein LRP31_14470 [Mesorhizobium mediterraneum]
MPNHLAEIYANNADLVILGGIATLASVGLCLMLRRIRRLTSDESEGESDPPEEASWDWESPVDLATEPASSSQVAVPSDTADLDDRHQDATYLRFGVRVEYFDVISEAYESSSVAQANAFASATNMPQSGRLATSVREIAGYVRRQVAANLAAVSSPVLRALSRMPTQLALAERGEPICGSAWDQLGHKVLPRKVAQLAKPSHRGLNVTARRGTISLDPDPTIARASPPRVRKPIGLVPRLGVAAICLAMPLSYAMRQNWVESAPAISRAQGTSVDLLSPDFTAARAQVGAAGGQAAAAGELGGQEHRVAESERARSAALQEALLESRKQIDALRTSIAASDNAHEERLRNELAAARTLDALRRIAGDARTMLREATNYVFTEMPAAHLERQRTEWRARDLSRARAKIEQLEAEAAENRAKAKASLAQASGMLDDERRKSENLGGDLAEVKLSNAALKERADAAEQERTGAVTARERVEQTAAQTEGALARERAAAASIREELKKVRLERDASAQERARAVSARERAEQTATETAQALARERAATASTRDELEKARLERVAAEQERARAVSATERAEQTATETAQALARERAAAGSTHEDLDKVRLERAAARALLVRVTRLNEALDKQREDNVSLARDLAAARADNDRLRAERRSAQIERPLKPRAGRAAAAAGGLKAVSQKTARSKVRDPSRIARVRSLTLPYSLRPRHVTLE